MSAYSAMSVEFSSRSTTSLTSCSSIADVSFMSSFSTLSASSAITFSPTGSSSSIIANETNVKNASKHKSPIDLEMLTLDEIDFMSQDKIDHYFQILATSKNRNVSKVAHRPVLDNISQASVSTLEGDQIEQQNIRRTEVRNKTVERNIQKAEKAK